MGCGCGGGGRSYPRRSSMVVHPTQSNHAPAGQQPARAINPPPQMPSRQAPPHIVQSANLAARRRQV